MPIFVDTSAWYALLDKTDSDHASAVEFKDSLNHSILTTNYVADEIWNDLESLKLLLLMNISTNMKI